MRSAAGFKESSPQTNLGDRGLDSCACDSYESCGSIWSFVKWFALLLDADERQLDPTLPPCRSPGRSGDAGYHSLFSRQLEGRATDFWRAADPISNRRNPGLAGMLPQPLQIPTRLPKPAFPLAVAPTFHRRLSRFLSPPMPQPTSRGRRPGGWGRSSLRAHSTRRASERRGGPLRRARHWARVSA